MKAIQPAHNRIVYASLADARLGSARRQSGVGLRPGTPFVASRSATFFCARKTLTHFLYRAQKTVVYNHTLCAIVPKLV